MPVRTAFLLRPDMFELIYGNDCLRIIQSKASLIFSGPLDPTLLDSTWPPGLAEVEVVFGGWGGPRFDLTLLNRLPHLRAVFHGGGSFRPHMTEAFWTRSITVCTAAAANAIPVAEYTLGVILLALKRAWTLHRQVRRERKFPDAMPAVPTGRGSTIGIVSLGRIGELVCERLRGFDVRVIAYDPTLPSSRFRELGVESKSLAEVMASSDVVSLHSPLIPETRGFINRRLLNSLKQGATIINTARGGLVLQDELIELLRRRPDVQAILDVTDPEPPPPNSPLYDLPNIFLTPHIAGSMAAECRRMGLSMVEEFGRYLRGEPLLFPLSREQAELHT